MRYYHLRKPSLLVIIIIFIFIVLSLSLLLQLHYSSLLQHKPDTIISHSNHHDSSHNSYHDILGFVKDNVRSQVHRFYQLTNKQLTQQLSQSYLPVVSLPDTKKLHILVTGGAGFVGSHLVDRLMIAGHRVTVIDNMFTGRQKNIAHWMGHPNFRLILHDVVEPIMLEVDQIYHLACPASPPHYQYNPMKTIKTSVIGTLNMLGLAKRIKARMLLTSTSEVYGDPKVHPQDEAYWGHVNPLGPRACYDEGKRVAETMMYAYEEQSNVEVRVARIFNTFGPRMHPNDGRVVSNFIIQALQGKNITIYGSGLQTRSFQFVDDLVEGLIRLMDSNYSQPVNIGNPDEYTVHDFAVLIKEMSQSNSTITMLPATKDDPQRRQPNITTAKSRLNWQPVITVREGLAKTIQYFRNELAESGTMPHVSNPHSF